MTTDDLNEYLRQHIELLAELSEKIFHEKDCNKYDAAVTISNLSNQISDLITSYHSCPQ